MSNVTYGRGQVEHALWIAFRGGSMSAPKLPPKVFLTRVKRLLEIDRAMDLSNREAPPARKFAFVDLPERPGGEVAFTPMDAVALGIALDLLDAGYKQSEVVFLLRHIRADFEGQLEEIVSGDRAKARKRGPKPKGLFLLIQKVEMKDLLNAPKLQGHVDPLLLEPVFCHGPEELSDALADIMPMRRRVVTVVELAKTARVIPLALANAPEIRRGRPKSK